jgi:glycosyltransferase involved in cell wall biosynthesis
LLQSQSGDEERHYIMDITKLKIGYVPYLLDLSQPGDRRRFPYFSKRNNIPFEIANTEKEYDVVLLTTSANLSSWLLYKQKHPGTKFIFEMVDSLIFPSDVFSGLFKGIGWFILGRETSLYVNYQKLIRKWLRNADTVLCSSTEIRNKILDRNKNVVVTPDYLEHEYHFCKTDYSINGKVKLLWEGQASVLPHFLYFKDVFKKLGSFCELHVITSEKYPRFGKLVYSDISKILDQLEIKSTFHKWDLEANCKIFSQCDIGIIPLNPKNIFGWHKPGNKLISFWFSGLPTVVSATPAYKEIMNSANENFYCLKPDEWISTIQLIYNMSREQRQQLAEKNLAFARNFFSDTSLDLIWNEILEKYAPAKS